MKDTELLREPNLLIKLCTSELNFQSKFGSRNLQNFVRFAVYKNIENK